MGEQELLEKADKEGITAIQGGLYILSQKTALELWREDMDKNKCLEHSYWLINKEGEAVGFDTNRELIKILFGAKD